MLKITQLPPKKTFQKGRTPIMEYLGESFEHHQWCRQLCRLQSYCKVVSKPCANHATARHRWDLWQAIRLLLFQTHLPEEGIRLEHVDKSTCTCFSMVFPNFRNIFVFDWTNKNPTLRFLTVFWSTLSRAAGNPLR